jgi:N-acetylmuramidase-like protein/SH3 domain-containing protein
MALPGFVKEHPNFRDGPSQQSNIIKVLDTGTKVDVLGRDGDYFQVEIAGQKGFVHVDYVTPDAPVEPPPATSQPESAAAAATFSGLELFTAPGLEVAANARVDDGLTVGRIWNSYGGLLKPLSDELGIDAAVAVAVLATESGGRGAGPDGRMIIRFENHIFFDEWGENHPDTFNQFFAFNPARRFNGDGHHWRPHANQDWRDCHLNQAEEWEILEFACTLDDRAAKSSISMGLTQIMGFNFADIGYGSVQEMFDAFSHELGAQIRGFFSYVRKRGGIAPLQAADYAAFARIYNGVGQEELYSRQISDGVNAVRALGV